MCTVLSEIGFPSHTVQLELGLRHTAGSDWSALLRQSSIALACQHTCMLCVHGRHYNPSLQSREQLHEENYGF
jgi:hypothetical protein